MLLCGPLWVFCGSFAVLCGPLRYLVIPVSRIDSRKDVHGRWTSLKTYSLLVLSAARKDKQELVHQDGTSMPAAPGKYPVNTQLLTYCICLHRK